MTKRKPFQVQFPRWAGKAKAASSRESPPSAIPEHVAILAMGPSLSAYVEIVKRMGARSAFVDEVWAINAVADILRCDRVFHMDDVRVQHIRAAAHPGSNIAQMLTWLRRHPGPIYTSIPHPDYPGTVAYPLAEVVQTCGVPYFNGTGAYAVAYAVHLGVKKISLFGFDFTFANAHESERGRACVEFHLGMAKARGIEIGLPVNSSLLDGNLTQSDRLYGYDCAEVNIGIDDDGVVRADFIPREPPTAEEIERRYDHRNHPSAQVRGK